MNQAAAHHSAAPGTAPDIRERGMPRNGTPQFSDRRVYFQLQVYTGSRHTDSLISILKSLDAPTVLYKSLTDPLGIGLLTMSERPEKLILIQSSLMNRPEFAALTHQPQFTMTGRTYSIGREADLEDWLLHKFRRNALNPAWPWAVWYPLRRKPEFAILPREEQGKMLAEHGMLGSSYAEGGHAYDIRLACYGIDVRDQEFVIGLVGPELFPLSRLVQEMRKTEHTSKYIDSLGPFFVGHVAWQSPFSEQIP